MSHSYRDAAREARLGVRQLAAAFAFVGYTHMFEGASKLAHSKGYQPYVTEIKCVNLLDAVRCLFLRKNFVKDAGTRIYRMRWREVRNAIRFDNSSSFRIFV